MRLPTRPAALTAFFAAGLILAGCSGPKLATVRGAVKSKGEPVTSGSITFYANGQPVASASILPEGTYTAESVPFGEVTATVVGGSVNIMSGPRPGGPGVPIIPGAPRNKGQVMKAPESAPPAPPPGAKVEAKFGKPETSGLKYTVDSKAQVLDIVLD